jgi:FtsX-like permease family
MRAVLFRVQRSLRRRWLSALVVTGLVAVVSGAVFTLAAGARRTSAAPDAFTAWVGGDVDGMVTQESSRPRTAEVAALPGVRSVDAVTFMFIAFGDPGPDSEQVLGFSGTRLASRLVAGRQADPRNPREFVAGRKFVAAHHARLGDTYEVASWSRAQAEAGQGFVEEPHGPTFEAEFVGIIESTSNLEDDYTTLVFSPALLDDDIGVGSTIMSVRARPGVTSSELRAQLDSLPDGSALSLEPGRIVSSIVRDAVGAQAKGIWLMAAVAAIASIVTLGQLLSRHARLLEAERDPLAALGFTDGQLAGESMSRAAVPAVAGVVIGALFAVVASGQFPAGFVRALEPNPGTSVDVVALTATGALLLVGVLAWVGAALLIARHRSAPANVPPVSDSIARRAPSPAAATGIRFALTSNERLGRSAAGTLVALGLIVAGLVAATTFATSLDRLVTDRGRFGGDYDFAIGDSLPVSADDLRTALEGDPDIAGLMILSGGQARAGGATVGLIGVETVRGQLEPRVLAGRLPSGADELALGRVTASQLHLHVGDELALAGAGGQGTFRIVGLAVVPGMGGNDGVGLGGVVTSAGLRRLEPNPDTNMAAIDFRRGAPQGAADRVAALFGATGGGESTPSAIVSVARVRQVPGLLALLLVALALLTTVHTLIVSIQGRRRDLAILRALGAGPRWIARAVHWQATVLGAAPLVLGVPLGLLAGSAVFRAFTNRIGAVPDPAIPIVLVLAMIAGLVAVANLAAVVPAFRARRVSTARMLRDE